MMPLNESTVEQVTLTWLKNLGYMICQARPDRYPNLRVKKIPKAVLARCKWGHDDYSLRVENLPQAPPPKGQMELFSTAEEDDK